MIQVYLLDCSLLFESPELERVLPLLDTQRRSKTLRLKTAERRAQSAGAGLLLRHVFGDVEYTYGTNEKPYLADRDDLFFSLSHSDRYVVCAVSDSEVGIDVEPVSPIRPAVVRRCFTPEEREWIGDDPERFIRLWTMKEAYMKLTGTGLSVPAKEIKLPIPPKAQYDAANNCFWAFPELPIPCSLCSPQEEPFVVISKDEKDLL